MEVREFGEPALLAEIALLALPESVFFVLPGRIVDRPAFS
jgi:hypothetical protein